jgi:hypothetical protein
MGDAYRHASPEIYTNVYLVIIIFNAGLQIHDATTGDDVAVHEREGAAHGYYPVLTTVIILDLPHRCYEFLKSVFWS